MLPTVRLLVFSLLVFAPVSLCQTRPAAGDLRVKTDQPGASVILDDVDVGETPLVVPGVVAGKHRVRVTKPGYASQTSEVDFKPGKPETVYVVLVRTEPVKAPIRPKLPAEFDVIHRHTAGHCKGRLIIQSDTVEYRSLDGRDSFRIPARAMTLVARDGGNTISGWVLGAVAAGGATSSAFNVPVIATVPVVGSSRNPPKLLPVRVETDGPKYSFVAIGVPDSGAAPAKDLELGKLTGATDQMFAIMDWLYREDLKARPKKGRQGEAR